MSTKMVTVNYAGSSDFAPLPGPYEGDVGLDLYVSEIVTLPHGEGRPVSLGIRVALPKGYWGFITPRSSTLRKYGLHVAAGVVDNGYRGVLQAFVVNLTNKDGITLEPGNRIAQMVLLPYVSAQVVRVDELSDTDRGHGGFGSTGR